MAQIPAGVIETSNTTGTGAYQFEGPIVGRISFVVGAGDGAQVYYTAQRRDGIKFEEAIGTVAAGSPDSLSRDAVHFSSNANQPVDWQVDDLPIYIYVAPPAPLLDRLAHGRASYIVGGGTANAITFTPVPKWTDYVDGNSIRVKLPATNTSTTVVANGSGLGDRSVKLPDGSDPPIGGLVGGAVVEFIYVAATNVLVAVAGASPFIAAGSITPAMLSATAGRVTGELADFLGGSAPTGWILADGRSIGNSNSSATNRADADTEALFTLLWNNYDNSILAVSGGRGGDAAADFAANKTIVVPDLRGRVTAGRDNMGGTSANRITQAAAGFDGDVLGASGGAQTHTHSVSGTTGNNNGSPGQFGNEGGSGSQNPHQHTFSTTSGAGSSMQPTWITAKIIKL